MHVLLAASGHPKGVIDALSVAPWYARLAGAALLGAGAFVLRELEKKRDGDSFFVDLVVFFLAFGAFILAYQGIFGSD